MKSTDLAKEVTQCMQVGTRLHNKNIENAHEDLHFIDSDCGCVGESSKNKCVYLNLCLDKELHDWIMSQGENYHKTLNSIIKKAQKDCV